MYVSTYAAAPYAGGADDGTTWFAFQTPIVSDIPNYLPDTRGLAPYLWRHYRLKNRGVNVFLLSDGTFVQDTPTTENSNAGIPLPWILNDPKNEYAYVTNWDGTISETFLDPHPIKVYEGGHIHYINKIEADALTAAGYTVYPVS